MNGALDVDVAILGAGIAGASLAGELASGASVALLEREAQPGYHTTGRSAALFSTTYGPPVIRALSRASRPFLETPPEGFAAAPLLAPRGALMAAREDQLDALEALATGVAPGALRRVSGGEARRLSPLLRESCAAGLHEEGARDLDVHALHQGCLRRLTRAGGTLRLNAEALAIEREGGRWRVETRGGAVRATTLVNAAGAWADEVAGMAGAPRIGLQPKRRTALIVRAPEGVEPDRWPMTIDIDEAFYLKPEAGRLLISPADETPSPPCDAQPEDLDVAICVDRIMTAFDLDIRRIERKWAGLRSFVADKAPVAGFDPAAPGFFWLAAQGGYGVQTAPALARLSAALILDRPVPADILDEGVSEAALSPARLRG